MVSPGNEWSPERDPVKRGAHVGHASSPEVCSGDAVLRRIFEHPTGATTSVPLDPRQLGQAWIVSEPFVRRAVWGDIVPREDTPIQLAALAGTRSASGRWDILVAAHPHGDPRYVVPDPHRVGTPDGTATWPEGFIDFGRHGAGFVVSIDPRKTDTNGQRLVDFRYLLSPAARQIEEDRFLSGESNSIIEAVVARAIQSRTGRYPTVESVARSAPPNSAHICYRLLEADGWRHFFSFDPSGDIAFDGLHHIESIPHRAPPPTPTTPSTSVGHVLQGVDSFYPEIGYRQVSVFDVERAIPTIRTELKQVIEKSYPGIVPSWHLGIHRTLMTRDDTLFVVALHDSSMRSYIPSDRASEHIVDQSFSAIIVRLPHPSQPGSIGVLGRLRAFAARLAPGLFTEQKHAPLEVCGPALSESAWLAQLDFARRSPRANFFSTAVSAAIERDLATGAHPRLPATVSTFIPIRTERAGNFWDKTVVCVDHHRGTHIVEIPRHRHTGLVALTGITTQQHFENTSSHGDP